MSLNMHKKNQISRRDDIENLIYVILYIWHRHQPAWMSSLIQNIDDKDKRHNEIIRTKSNLDIICQNTPISFRKILKHVRNLRFEEKPKYTQYINLLCKI